MRNESKCMWHMLVTRLLLQRDVEHDGDRDEVDGIYSKWRHAVNVWTLRWCWVGNKKKQKKKQHKIAQFNSIYEKKRKTRTSVINLSHFAALEIAVFVPFFNYQFVPSRGVNNQKNLHINWRFSLLRRFFHSPPPQSSRKHDPLRITFHNRKKF